LPFPYVFEPVFKTPKTHPGVASQFSGWALFFSIVGGLLRGLDSPAPHAQMLSLGEAEQIFLKKKVRF
jgi:hypothetical protein